MSRYHSLEFYEHKLNEFQEKYNLNDSGKELVNQEVSRIMSSDKTYLRRSMWGNAILAQAPAFSQWFSMVRRQQLGMGEGYLSDWAMLQELIKMQVVSPNLSLEENKKLFDKMTHSCHFCPSENSSRVFNQRLFLFFLWAIAVLALFPAFSWGTWIATKVVSGTVILWMSFFKDWGLRSTLFEDQMEIEVFSNFIWKTIKPRLEDMIEVQCMKAAHTLTAYETVVLKYKFKEKKHQKAAQKPHTV